MQGEAVRIQFRGNGGELDVACATAADAERIITALARAMVGESAAPPAEPPAATAPATPMIVGGEPRDPRRSIGRWDRVEAWAEQQSGPWNSRQLFHGIGGEFPTEDAARVWIRKEAEKPGSRLVKVSPGAFVLRNGAPQVVGGARAEADPFRDGAGRAEPGAGASRGGAEMGGVARA